MKPSQTYREVRALERGLQLIQAMSQSGWSTPSTLARLTGIDRTTIYRLLATLVRCGYIVERKEDRAYILGTKICELASGVRDVDSRSVLVSPILAELVRKILWPSDFAVLSGGALRIMASSHQLTSMTFFRGLVGKERPILKSALGRAILAAMTQEELELTLLAARDNASETERAEPDLLHLQRILAETREAGYASSTGNVHARISAIALPVIARAKVAGAVNIVFFRSAMTPAQAAERYLESLRETVALIEMQLAGQPDGGQPGGISLHEQEAATGCG